MRKIQNKLITSYSVIVMFSILLLSVPMLKTQISEIKTNINQTAALQMSASANSVNVFIKDAVRVVKDVSLLSKADKIYTRNCSKRF